MVTAATIILPQQHQPQLVEVIGGNGRIGSQFMRLLRRDAAQSQQSPIAVPRGVCPGSISTSADATESSSLHLHPIFVCTPSDTWSTIYETTTPSWRCSDLVFIGNGLLPPNIKIVTGNDKEMIDTYSKYPSEAATIASTKTTATTTIVIPHYGILNVGDPPTTTCTGMKSALSPPTYIAGKHSHTVQRLLELDGITNIQRYDTITADVIKYMIQKVIWTSCLWLLCHTMNHNPSLPSPLSPPLTVSQVHLQHKTILFSLVEELWPSIQQVYTNEVYRWMNHNTTISTIEWTVAPPMTLPDVIQYMEQYSFSIPNAIPSKALAIQEIESRNKIFTGCCHNTQQEQPIHYKLLQQIFNNSETPNHSIFHHRLPVALPRSGQPSPSHPSTTKIIDLRSTIGMAVYGHQRQKHHENAASIVPIRIVIVGAGILGSSVAFNLARLRRQQISNNLPGVNITVIDSQCTDMSDTNITTKSSFGWINANFMKQPLSYQTLNLLGIHAWYNDPVLMSLPQWSGSIIRKRRTTGTNNMLVTDTAGYYNQCIGPLSESDLYSLEPNVTFASERNEDTSVYYFPNEGFVDPCDAVHLMRKEAKRLGVSFLWNCTVQGMETKNPIIDTNDQPPVYTVEYQSNDGPSPTTSTIDADVIVIAAGIGSSNVALGGLPMQQTNCSGSTIQFVHNTNNNTTEPTSAPVQLPKDSLQQIVVDMVNETHLLQRRNGAIVVGGGSPLHVGGTNVVATTTTNKVSKHETFRTPLTVEHQTIATKAQNLIPIILDTMMVDQIHVAERPIPLDGLPSIGYYQCDTATETMIKSENHSNLLEDMKLTVKLDGIYSLVCHSGITLAPLLGALAAIEILEPNLSIEILRLYRPERLFALKSRSL